MVAAADTQARFRVLDGQEVAVGRVVLEVEQPGEFGDRGGERRVPGHVLDLFAVQPHTAAVVEPGPETCAVEYAERFDGRGERGGHGQVPC